MANIHFYTSKDLEIYLAFVLKANVREISVTIDDYLLHKMFIFFSVLCPGLHLKASCFM